LWPLLVALAVARDRDARHRPRVRRVPTETRYLVPVGGMVIGNAMMGVAIALNRLGDEVHDAAGRFEPASRWARRRRRRCARSRGAACAAELIALIDSTKKTGLILFPGRMVGMLLAGAAPVDAVRLQLILLYVLLGADPLATPLAVVLSRRAFFTSAHQLRELPSALPAG